MAQDIDITILPDGRMNTRNAAAYVGLTVKTLAMKRCTGTGPRYVKRGRVFYYKTDLDDWLTEGRALSTADSGNRAAGLRHPATPASL